MHPPSHPTSRSLHSELDLHSDSRGYGSGKKLRGVESVGRIFIFNLEAKEEVEYNRMIKKAEGILNSEVPESKKLERKLQLL